IDSSGNASPRRRERYRLPVVTAGGRNDACHFRLGTSEAIHGDDIAAYFERTVWRVILVFHPHGAADTRAEFGPSVLRRGRYHSVNQGGCLVEIVQGDAGVGHRRLLSSATGGLGRTGYAAGVWFGALDTDVQCPRE